MTFNISTYMARQYGEDPCWPMVADIYVNELGQTVDDYKTVGNSRRAVAEAFRIHMHKSPHGFRQVEQPVENALVFMGRTVRLGITHVGIYCQGKVLHATEQGTFHQDLFSLRAEYAVVEYWAK